MTFRTVALEILAPIVLLACWSGPSAAGTAAPTRVTMLVHGNYCGFGNNAPLAPVDALDAACARHDACTPDGDLPTKACNARLEREAATIANDLRQPGDVRTMAGLVAAFAASHQFKAVQEATPGEARHRRPRRAYMNLR